MQKVGTKINLHTWLIGTGIAILTFRNFWACFKSNSGSN